MQVPASTGHQRPSDQEQSVMNVHCTRPHKPRSEGARLPNGSRILALPDRQARAHPLRQQVLCPACGPFPWRRAPRLHPDQRRSCQPPGDLHRPV